MLTAISSGVSALMSNPMGMCTASSADSEIPASTSATPWRCSTPDAGELLKVYVFAACLPYSGELYAEGFYDMKEESWVAAHVHVFSFYGGSVPIIVPDNLKQGISKNTFDELVVNDQYRRMAEYYGCAVVPARPRRPRGKGAVEMGVRVIDSAPWRRCATACSPRSRS